MRQALRGGLLADRPPEKRRLIKLFDLFTDDGVTYRIAVILDQKEVVHRAAKAAFASFLLVAVMHADRREAREPRCRIRP